MRGVVVGSEQGPEIAASLALQRVQEGAFIVSIPVAFDADVAPVGEAEAGEVDGILQIANMHAGPERFGYVERGDNANTIVNIDLNAIKDFFGTGGKYVTLEWLFGGIAFDGFWRSRCTVVEAKGNFGHFFDEDGDAAKPFTNVVVAQWRGSYMKQAAVVAATQPQGKLEWHFMDVSAYRAGVEVGIPASSARLTPYIVGRFP